MEKIQMKKRFGLQSSKQVVSTDLYILNQM